MACSSAFKRWFFKTDQPSWTAKPSTADSQGTLLNIPRHSCPGAGEWEAGRARGMCRQLQHLGEMQSWCTPSNPPLWLSRTAETVLESIPCAGLLFGHETHTPWKASWCLLEAREADAGGLQLHGAVAWVQRSSRASRALACARRRWLPRSAGCRSLLGGGVGGPRSCALPLCTVSPRFCQPRGGCWWAACAGCSAAAGAGCGPSPWPSSCAGGRASRAHTARSCHPLAPSAAAAPKAACRVGRYLSPWPTAGCRQSRTGAYRRPRRLRF